MSNEIAHIGQNTVIEEPDKALPLANTSAKVITVSHDKCNFDFKGMLAAAVQMFSAADILNKLEKGIEYVVQVPAEYQEQLRNGTLEMMQSSDDGKMWATIVKRLENGKPEIVCNCPIKDQLRVQGNPIQDLTGVYQNLYMQQKLAELSEQIQDVYDAVLRIEQGQMDDRIGKLLSGRDDILCALKNPDLNEKTQELRLARSKVSEAQHQIGQVFKSRVESFKPIPENKFVLILKEITAIRTDYMKKQDEEFRKLQDIFEFYLRASQLLAWSYIIVDDMERAETVFELCISFLQTIDFTNISTLDFIYPDGSMDDAFYHEAIPCFQNEKAICLENARPYEYIQIPVTSDELMEALEYGETV